MKPSEIVMHVPPLAATMHKAEAEAAAALIVHACAALGDKWQPISARQIGNTLHADVDAKREPWVSLVRNPYWRPDVFELVRRGFARWVDHEGGSCELTAFAAHVIVRWWAPSPDASPATARRTSDR